jgi:hypothetical protein
VSLNLIDGEVYLIQHYVIKFVSDLLQVHGFIWVIRSGINWFFLPFLWNIFVRKLCMTALIFISNGSMYKKNFLNGQNWYDCSRETHKSCIDHLWSDRFSSFKRSNFIKLSRQCDYSSKFSLNSTYIRQILWHLNQVVLNCCINDSSWHWQSINDKIVLPLSIKNIRKDVIEKYDLCLTGEVSQEY